MVRCTGSWPPVQRGGGTPPGISGFSRRLFPGWGLPCFLLNSPPHPHPTPPTHSPAQDGSPGCGRAEKTPAGMGSGGGGGGHGDTAGPVTLYPAFGLFLTSGFQEIKEGGRRKDKGKEETLSTPLPTRPSLLSWLAARGAHRPAGFSRRLPGGCGAEMLGRHEGPSGAVTALTAGSQGLSTPPGSRVAGLFNLTLHVGKLRQGGGECPHSHTVGQ